MRIFIVARMPFPYGMASTNRIKNYVSGFNKLGIANEVIIPISVDPWNKESRNKEANGFYEKTRFRYISGNPKRNKIKLLRPLLDVIYYCKTALVLLNELKKGDIIITVYNHLIWYSVVAIIVHIKKAKIVAEINELPYGATIQTAKTKIRRRIILKYIFPRFDGFITISKNLENVMKKYNFKNNNTIRIPILVDTNINNQEVKEVDINKPFIFHSGTLYEQKDGIVGMLEAFAIANKKLNGDLFFYLTGDINSTVDKTAIMNVIKKYEIDEYVKFLGFVDDKLLRRYQKSCSLMIINKYKTQQNKYCFSTKLGEYLAFKKPVIITAYGEAMEYLKNGISAYIVEPNATKQIAESIIEIIQNPEKAEEIGKKGYEVARNDFNYITQTKKMVGYFNQLVN